MLRCLLTSRGCLAHYSRYGVLWQHVQHLTRPRPFSDATAGDSAASGQSRASVGQGRSKAAFDLAYLVSERNALSSSPWLQTPHDIKGFYRAVKAKGLLHELSSDELSSLIQLFGSLSTLAEPPNQLVTSESAGIGPLSIHPLAPILYERQTSSRRAHWTFVLSVAKDKVVRGLPLGESDNYWLMRAALEDAKRIHSEDSNDTGVRLCLDRARKHYTSISTPSRDEWSIHELYLTAILGYGGREYCDEVVVRLAKLISSRGGLPSGLRSILWRVLAFPGAVISPSTKSRFLHILRMRLAKVQDILPKLSSHLSSGVQPDDRDNVHFLKLYDALAIRDYLVDIVFSFRPGMRKALRYLQEVYPWAVFECRAALCAFNDGTFATSEDEDRAAWSNLVLLALSFAPVRKTSGSGAVAGIAPEQGLDGGLRSQSQVLGWTVICALAALSSELHVRSHVRKRVEPSSVPGIQDITRTLWFLWRKEEAWRAGAVTRAMSLICCTTTSFMALASISGDSRLAVSLVQHISDAIIYPAQLGVESLDRSMLHECAVHFAVLVATWGVGSSPQHSWDGILGALRYAQLISDDEKPSATGRTNSIVNSTIMHFTRIDPILSHRLLQSAPEYGLAMKDNVVLAVGKALAVKGHCDLALMYLKDRRISAHNATHLLNVLLIYTLHYHQGHLHPDLVGSFTDVFTNTSIRPTNKHALESFIHACTRAGYLEESVKIVQRASSTLLRPQFLAQLVTALVSNRRYRLLEKVFEDTWRKAPIRRSSFFRGSRLQYTEQMLRKFPKSTTREVARSIPFSVYVWPILRHHIPFHPRLARLNKNIISLKLSSQLQKAEKLDEKTLEQAVHLLVRTGRITAALKLLSKHATTISTKTGNIILSTSLQPRSQKQLRQVRHASARLAQLLQERGFVPDRVTLNLLMKSVLRWRNITPKEMLRTLFDRLTMNGYPVPDDVLHALSKPDPVPLAGQSGSPRAPRTLTSRTVFGTDTSPSGKDGLSINLEAFPMQISFTRHTRPLYNMFVKAFKARGDRKAAQQVARVLQKVKESVMRERAIRDEARRLGRIRARRKLQRAKS